MRGGDGAVSADLGWFDVRPTKDEGLALVCDCGWMLDEDPAGATLATLVRHAEAHWTEHNTRGTVAAEPGDPLPPGWAARQAAQADPHLIIEK
jgi:hypothetical protein